MLTVDQIRELATRAADGNTNAMRVFRDLAATVGITANAGWVTLPGGRRPFAHGWRRAAAAFAASTGWTGKDLLVEMSKRSASPDDVAAAHDEAVADAAAYAQNAEHLERSRRDDRGMHMGPGHVAPATIATAYDEAVAEDERRLAPPTAPATLPEVEQQGDYYANVPQPRADRLAAAFERFTLLADSGGPGTSKGLIAAAERATTVTEQQVESAARAMIERLNSIGLSTPVRVNPHALADIFAVQLEALGFAVVK